jgi:hypothetical protein
MGKKGMANGGSSGFDHHGGHMYQCFRQFARTIQVQNCGNILA